MKFNFIKKLIFLISILSFLIINVNALVLTVDIPEKYNQVSAGERFFFTLAVKYPENPTRIDLRLNYEIRNQAGELVAQTKVLKAVETQASFIDSIVIPENVEGGFHTIDVLVNDYGDMNEKVGTSFQITSKSKDKTDTYLLIIAIAIVLLFILVLYDINRKK